MRTIPNAQPTQPTQVEVDKLMICLVDRSGSMEGSKDMAATEFVRDAFLLAQSENFKTFGIVEFTTFSSGQSDNIYDLSKPLLWNPKDSNGRTPLYREISKLIDKLKDYKGKVLINVISDGENTEGGERYVKQDINKFIELGQTITFICTESDKRRFTAIGIPDSNIQTYNNTGEGLAQTFEVYRGAVQNYSVSVAKGEDVTKGFYKTVKN